MINARASQFKLVLIFTTILTLVLSAYILWAVVDSNSNHALSESQFLAQYTERAISRYHANPTTFAKLSDETLTKLLGNDHINVAFNYTQLQQQFPSIPAANEFKHNTVKAILMNYRGLFKTPHYLLVLPTNLNTDQVIYSYFLVDAQLKDNYLELRLLEKVQPAILIAFISIFVLVIIELFHISKMNTNINAFADWASKLSAGVNSPPIPEFSSSKFNYMAFTIDKNLSGISQMLAQEQSFAKFTSHELRTPIAVLSANMEVLELMMKDLSPQERNILNNMESAVSDMKYQMEALLWLSRESEADVDYASCVMRDLIDKAIQDNAYLTEGKNISTEVLGKSININSNSVFLQIILNNLLRNAYQNTHDGKVTLELMDNTLVIENVTALKIPDEKKSGFGIGLILVDKLVRKIGIGYDIEKRPNGRLIKLTF